MDPVMDVDLSSLKNRFHRACQWIVCGSILFESGKVLYFYFLIHFLNNQAMFGVLGSLISMVFLTARIIDFGAANSIPPYYPQFKKSKQNFKKLLFKYFLLPGLPLFIIAPCVMLYVFNTKFPGNPIFMPLIPLWIILETIRQFFRLFLHVAGKTAKVVSFELGVFVVFLLAAWIPLLLFNATPTLNLLFIPFIIDTILGVSYFAVLATKFYRTLPNDTPTVHATIWKRLTQTRALNLLLRVSRDIFASNLLTPLFAIKCGLAQAGLFYFASQLARLLQEILKGPLNYSGNAMLANLKEGTIYEKKAAFSVLSQKLAALLAPIIIFLSINYQWLVGLAKDSSATGMTINFTMLFLLIALSESCFILYEQFYIIEEATTKLFLFKIIDFSLFYVLILSQNTLQPIPALVAIIGIRALSFCLISINAYWTWHILPNIKIGWRYTIGCFAVAGTIAYSAPKIMTFISRCHFH